MDNAFRESALDYHRRPTAGKIAIKATKPLTTQRDLALAYSPGVAAPCEEIAADPSKAYEYTSRGNLVAVISNGTAVLGLGAIGALASKPVMEGKSVLFKKFADIDSIDIELDETDIDKIVDAVAMLEPSFGGINLEDIKAPECFEIEKRLRERMNIPVFHDDQHGTAIIVGAAFTNWIHLTGRDMKDIKLVASGAGASAIACLTILHELGLPKENITVTDRNGVVYKGREEGMDPYKEKFAIDTNARTLEDAIENADVFLGLSGPGVLNKELVGKMSPAPLIMALANPTPEIMPEEAREAQPEAIICTGRSDYTNQVNNVLCFPFIFRGALDVGATAINEEMKVACVKAIAELARQEASHEVMSVYADESLDFGPEYLIPKPFDPRLIVNIPIAVAKAAMETGVATRPIEDFEAYKEKLQQYFYQSNLLMRPIFSKSRANPKRVVYAEGEDERVLRAIQTVVDEGLAFPIIIGRRKVVEMRIKQLRLRLELDNNCELCDPESDPRYKSYWTHYHKLMARRGVTPAMARTHVRTNTTVIAALMVEKGEADAMICGTENKYKDHLEHIQNIIGFKPGIEVAAALVILINSRGNYFMCDTHINLNPSVTQLSEMTLLAAEEIRRFGIDPKVALLSHSNFGSHDDECAQKMRHVQLDLSARAPYLEVDGEMHADSALSEDIRERIMPGSKLKGKANLMVMPNMQAANITYNTVKMLTDSTVVGPILLGMNKPAHIVTTAVSPRGIVNMTAMAVVGAQVQPAEVA
jgi:malate dehydrogenase (oxaloacetate-decarboxylating)(NADP+)